MTLSLRAMRLLALASVIGAAAMVVGCTTRPVVPGGATPHGNVATRPGRPGVVVAAPHGTSDIGTAEIAAEIARRTGFGLVVATGFDVTRDSRGGPGRRYQVNRPVEGVPGRPAAEDADSGAARTVYEAYERSVREVSQGPLRFYAEIHGNGRPDAVDRIEIATVGVDVEDAEKLRTLFELVRDAHLRARPAPARRADRAGRSARLHRFGRQADGHPAAARARTAHRAAAHGAGGRSRALHADPVRLPPAGDRAAAARPEVAGASGVLGGR